MAEGDDLIDEAFLYVSEKKYPDGASATRKRIIRKKAEKFVIVDVLQTWKREAGKMKKVCKIKFQWLLELL